jgi:large subunit ribosomal protein L17
MKKNTFGRKLKRDTNERKALFKNLLTSLVLSERIKTSEAKAKAIKSAADKLITKAKIGGRDAERALEAKVHHEAVVKLIDDLAGRFTERSGGYTRIIKAGRRVADNAPMAIMEWVEKKAASNAVKTDKKATSNVAKKEVKKVEKKAPVKKVEKKIVKKEAKKK